MESKYNYFKRDISWLSFNYRVLLEALDERLPLYERINFISIYSSNLEEFYKIRVADHKAVASGATESDEETVQSARELVEEINKEVTRQLDDRVRIYEEKLLPALRKNHIIFYQDRHVEPFHQQFIKDFFREEIFPYLQPVPVSKDKIVSFLRDNRLYLAIRVYPKKEGNEGTTSLTESRQPLYFVMKQPYAKVPRFIELPSREKNHYLMFTEDIIKANNFITFAYSSLDDRWFYLSMKAGDDYDSTKILGNLNQAYAYMLEECQYYWLKRNRLLQPDLTVDAIIASLSPEIHGLLDAFLEPYVKAAEKFL